MNSRRAATTRRSAPPAAAATSPWCRMGCGERRGERWETDMAKLPAPIPLLVDQFGPHPKHTPPGGWQATGEVDRVVKTHCCFCGQQCGIQLKVKDNRVVGFEPWEDFPFNRG